MKRKQTHSNPSDTIVLLKPLNTITEVQSSSTLRYRLLLLMLTLLQVPNTENYDEMLNNLAEFVGALKEHKSKTCEEANECINTIPSGFIKRGQSSYV